MLAYKVFNSGWRCRNLKYEVGKTYKMDGVPVLCEKGFHACLKLQDCFNYYSFSSTNKVAIVDIYGFIKGQNTDKICGSRITIKEELTWHECLNLVNNGHSNNGHSNSGDSNSGHCNSGHYNSGRYNSGDYNSGDWN
ncbi:MAG: hypothetical protein GY841_08635, partial [FCB group bacterium]|nr:hypothetical protein [FCB group bacterium]